MKNYFCLGCPNSYDDDEALYCFSDLCKNPVRLLHGDCLELMKDIPDGSVDMILTDPPYGINFRSGRRKDRYEKIIGDFTIDYLDDFFRSAIVSSAMIRRFTAFAHGTTWTHSRPRFVVNSN